MYGIKKWEDKIKREEVKYRTKNCTYNFQQYETIIYLVIIFIQTKSI